jgi:hypothetical protein
VIWKCLYPWFVANATINAAAAVFPSWLPQQNTTFPALTFSIDDNLDDQLLDGVGTLRQAFVSVECWARSFLAAHTLADVVKAQLIGFTGPFGNLASSPQVKVEVDHVRKVRELDLYESDTRLHRVSLQFLIAYGD